MVYSQYIIRPTKAIKFDHIGVLVFNNIHYTVKCE